MPSKAWNKGKKEGKIKEFHILHKNKSLIYLKVSMNLSLNQLCWYMQSLIQVLSACLSQSLSLSLFPSLFPPMINEEGGRATPPPPAFRNFAYIPIRGEETPLAG